MENGTQMTLDQWMPETYPMPTVGASDFHVRTSALQESNSDLLGTAQACFSELCTWLDNSKKKKSPLTCSLRTLRICFLLMEDGISPDFSLSWTKTGTMQNGEFSTANIMECHNTENDCSLSEVLEEEVGEEYYMPIATIRRLINPNVKAYKKA